MAVTEIGAPELLRQARLSVGLPPTLNDQLDEPLLAALVRRAASFLCPCSRATVASVVIDSLEFLSNNADTLRYEVEAAIEGLIAFGDLLELNQVTIDDPDAKGTWIFSAPLGFVRRKSGTIILLGIARDESTPLPSELKERVVYNRYSRLIPANGQDIALALLELGLLSHSEETWMRGPPPATPQALIDKVETRLFSQSASGDMPELTFIKHGTDVSYYRGRWGTPRGETGIFVSRRPQEFGRDGIWGVVQLSNGAPLKFMDLPTKTRWRGCDEAWYIQMALDAARRTPQRYRVRPTPDGAYLDFFSPVPSWAERRLAAVGDPAPREKCLFSYRIPHADVQAEEYYLQEHLWLTRLDDKKMGTG